MVSIGRTYMDEPEPQAAPKPEAKAAPTRAPGIGRTEYDVDALIDATAKKYNIDPIWVRAIVKRESGGNPNAQGPEVEGQGRAGGLMQLMPGTAKMLGVTDVFDPVQNLDAGVRYFLGELGRADGDYTKALKMYHGGRDERGWGPKTQAYAQNVMQTYRDLGGRQYDPEVGKSPWWQTALQAALPVRQLSEAVAERMPNLSRWSTDENGATTDVGPLTRWWRGTQQKRERDPQSVLIDKQIANSRDAEPFSTLGIELGASLPLSLGAGALANRGLAALGRAAPQTEGTTNFLLGRAGYGRPGTGEGASTLGKIASGGAQGALQGAVGGAATNFLTPETDMLEDAGFGAALGLGMGALGTGIAQGAGRVFYGPRMHPATAKLGQEVMAGEGMPQMSLSSAPGNVTRLALSTPEFTRKSAATFGEEAMPNTAEGWRKVEAKIGRQLEDAARNAHIPLDRIFATGLMDVIEALPDAARNNASIRRITGDLVAEMRAAVRSAIPGEEYLSMTARGGPGKPASELARALNSPNSEIRLGATALRNFLGEELERGAQERVRFALARGDVAEVEKASRAVQEIRAARESWKNLKTFQEVADPVTGEVQPKDLSQAVERHFRTDLTRAVGDVPKMARAGSVFDETLLNPRGSRLLPLSGVAALVSGLIHAPVTTGQAALGLGASALAGKLGLDAARGNRPFVNSLLRRSAEQRPGRLQSGLGRISVPLATAAGNRLVSPPDQ